MILRPAHPRDLEAVWNIFQTVVAAGDSFVFTEDFSQTEFRQWWFGSQAHPFVAEDQGVILGSYVFKPNQPGRRSHIANAAYMVSPEARGRSLGQTLGEHSLTEAKKAGFRAMQFNAVVSSNQAAVRLWEKLGFKIIGSIPGAFRHAHLGPVATHIMFREL